MFLTLLMYATSVSTFAFGKFLLSYTTPLFLTGLRTLLAGSFFLGYAAVHKQQIKLKQLIILTLPIALCTFLLSNSFKFMSLIYLQTQQTAFISMLEPLCAGILAYILCNERLTHIQFFGLGICMMGSLAGLLEHGFSMFGDQLNLLGIALFLISLVAGSLGAILMRRIILQNHSIILVNGTSMLLGGCIALSTSLCFDPCVSTVSTSTLMPFISTLLIMILLSNIIGYSLYGLLLKRYSVMFISCASFLRPFFTHMYQWLFLNQELSLYTIGTALIVLAGLRILYKQEQSIHESQARTDTSLNIFRL